MISVCMALFRLNLKCKYQVLKAQLNNVSGNIFLDKMSHCYSSPLQNFCQQFVSSEKLFPAMCLPLQNDSLRCISQGPRLHFSKQHSIAFPRLHFFKQFYSTTKRLHAMRLPYKTTHGNAFPRLHFSKQFDSTTKSFNTIAVSPTKCLSRPSVSQIKCLQEMRFLGKTSPYNVSPR
jgi:hypothetical protein